MKRRTGKRQETNDVYEDYESTYLNELQDEDLNEEEVDSIEDFPVEKIIDKRKRYGKLQYLVKWQSNDPNSWHYIADLEGCQGLINEFEESLKPPKPSMITASKVLDWALIGSCVGMAALFAYVFVSMVEIPVKDLLRKT